MFRAADHPKKSRRPEIIEGIFREGQIVTLCGPFSAGKTPILKDWAVAVAAGIDWCGCATTQRPVVILDFESDDGEFYENIVAIATRRVGASTPLDISLYLRSGDDEEAVEEVYKLMHASVKERFSWLEARLVEHPNALFVIDPIQLLYNIDKNKSQDVTALFNAFRTMKRRYRGATFVFVYNLRKDSTQTKERPSLLEYPHDWLQEISGSLDLQNRSDVRLGMEFMTRGERDIVVLNGIRRGETMEPFVLEAEVLPIAEGEVEPRKAGFRRVDPTTLDTEQVFTGKMNAAWLEMDRMFTAKQLVAASSNGTAYRLIARAKRMGLVREVAKGEYEKSV